MSKTYNYTWVEPAADVQERRKKLSNFAKDPNFLWKKCRYNKKR